MTLTHADRHDITELLQVASRHLEDLTNDALNTRISRPMKLRLETYIDRARELQDKLKGSV